jgi:hypothetical protein
MLVANFAENSAGSVIEEFNAGSSITALPYLSVWCSSGAPSMGGNCHQPAGLPTLSRGSVSAPWPCALEEVAIRREPARTLVLTVEKLVELKSRVEKQNAAPWC